MHPTALRSCKQFFEVYGESLPGTVVVDVGSQDVNGSLRDVCPPSFRYTGVDFVPGRGVDVVIEDPYRLPFEDESTDAVLCSSCFEHAELFWLLFLDVLRVLKPHGLFYLNVPSNGAFHRYPVDCWRFYPDSGKALVNWARRNGLKTVLLESFTSQQQEDIWNDYVAIFLKDEDHLARYPKRISDLRNDYTNGYVFGDEAVRNPSVLSEDEVLRVRANNRILQLKEKLEGLLMEREVPAAGPDARVRRPQPVRAVRHGSAKRRSGRRP